MYNEKILGEEVYENKRKTKKIITGVGIFFTTIMTKVFAIDVDAGWPPPESLYGVEPVPYSHSFNYYVLQMCMVIIILLIIAIGITILIKKRKNLKTKKLKIAIWALVIALIIAFVTAIILLTVLNK